MPGASMAVSRAGSVVFARAWGYADVATQAAAEPGTRFRIASVTKPYVGALALLLARDGALLLDDRAARWLPEFPRADEFTVRMLLNHTAGLGEYTRRPLADLARDANREYTDEALLEYMAAVTPLFIARPGAAWTYSNTGYVLLGIILARAGGAPLPALLDRHVTGPAGLQETGWGDDQAASLPAAAGYGWEGEWIRAPRVSNSYIGASGAVNATARDICLWFDTLFGGGHLREAELAEMIAPAVLSGGAEFVNSAGSRYGLGVWTGSADRGRVYWHTGTTAGFAADARHYADAQVSIAMLGNASAQNVTAELRQIREAVFGALDRI